MTSPFDAHAVATAKRQEEWIEKARRATGARAVRLHEIPQWAKRAMQSAYRDEPGSGLPAMMAFVNDERWRGLFDHWGTSQGAGTKTLCTEPYANRDQIEAALRFADWLGCDVEIGGASWWYPGSTVRIEFAPREETP